MTTEQWTGQAHRLLTETSAWMSAHAVPIVTVAVIATVAAQLLKGFYATFHAQWPENYFGGQGGIDPVISRGFWRYLLFRTLPAAVAIGAAGTTAVRFDQPRGPAIALTTMVYLAQGPRRAVVDAIRNPRRRTGVVAYRVSALGGTVLVALVVTFVGDGIDRFLPTGREFIAAIWTGLFVLVVGPLARATTADAANVAPRVLTERARSEIDEVLLHRLRSADCAVPAALEAIALAEQLNRPRWVRRIERVLVRSRGTYGLMQVTADRPLSDEESIDHFLASVSRLPYELRYPSNGDTPRALFLAHNDDAEFADLATQLYWSIREMEPDDGTWNPEVKSAKRQAILAMAGGAVLVTFAVRRARNRG